MAMFVKNKEEADIIFLRFCFKSTYAITPLAVGALLLCFGCQSEDITDLWADPERESRSEVTEDPERGSPVPTSGRSYHRKDHRASDRSVSFPSNPCAGAPGHPSGANSCTLAFLHHRGGSNFRTLAFLYYQGG